MHRNDLLIMQRILIIFFLIVCSPAFAQLKIARIFSDHAVLQRQKPIPVWGWAKPNEKITISLGNQSLNVRTDANGKWIARFAPMEAGGPFQLIVTAKSEKVTLSDILIGEVWLCSGQSNMEWPVSAADRFQEEKKNADYPAIRHFRVEHEVSLTQEKDLTKGEWKIASPETIGGFSAVGFFFAREIYQKLNIPVGILHTSWGGSQIEGWISKEAMLTNDELRSYAENLPATWEQADAIMSRKLRKQLFTDASYIPTTADEQKYIDLGYDGIRGVKSSALGQWDWKGLMGFRGKGFMAKQVEVPADIASAETTLSLAENDGPTQVYINGKLISDNVVKGVRKITLPAGAWKTGNNQLVIKLGNMQSLSWFGPGLNGKTDDLFLSAGAQKISLASDWKLMPSFAEKHEFAHLMNNVGTTIYNAMIAPVVSFGIKGVLWYQGESNAGRAFQYRQSFPLMINNWRNVWSTDGKPDNFSFYWVQLSSYGANQDSNKGSTWAELREAQNMTLMLPKTGMAVTTDIGNAKDIHPTNKQDVAHRLATNALKFDYGKDIPYSSPLYHDVKFDGSRAIVNFDHTDGGLVAKDRYGYLKGFEIAGEDKVFYFAKAEIAGNTVVVSHPKVTQPVAVRYAWADAPEEANLFNGEGFPASAFRTDTWPGITVKNKFE